MFLKNPPIIFLDEPTASLVAIATEQIKQSLDEIKQGRTVIIISHSLSQIIDADYTYVMKDGRIAEHGEHDALYHQNGVYKEIFDAMAKSLNIEKIANAIFKAAQSIGGHIYDESMKLAIKACEYIENKYKNMGKDVQDIFKVINKDAETLAKSSIKLSVNGAISFTFASN